MSPTDLEAYGIYEGRNTSLLFEGGVKVNGEIITGKRNLQGKIILISFRNCTVTFGDQILFKPSWGIYDMAVGASVISAFSGIADPNAFGQQFEIPKEKTHKINYSSKEKALFELYEQVRAIRKSDQTDHRILKDIFGQLRSNYPNDWLLVLEIYEILSYTESTQLSQEVKLHLTQSYSDKHIKQLIEDGIQLIEKQMSTM